MVRYLAVHNAFSSDRLESKAGGDVDYRVIGHSNARKATVWRFVNVKDQDRLVLQMYRNGDSTMDGTGVGYLTVGVRARTSLYPYPVPPMPGLDLAVTRYPAMAATVRIGAMPKAGESVPPTN